MQFSPLRAFVDASFFHSLANEKLESFRLDDSEVELNSSYRFPLNSSKGGCIISLSSESFHSVPSLDQDECISPGLLQNVNTLSEFTQLDKSQLLISYGQRLFDDIVSGSCSQNPSQLSRFHLLSFADLKKYQFRYWFAFPALRLNKWRQLENKELDFPAQDLPRSLEEILKDYQKQSNIKDRGFFILRHRTNEGWEAASLSCHGTFWEKDEEASLGFVDIATLPGIPSWHLRNFLAWFAITFKERTKLSVYCWRGTGKSFWLHLERASPYSMPKRIESSMITGWERNKDNLLKSKIADLGALIDPHRLADQAVDLNLKLMKWRIAPDLHLQNIKDTKVLLLGAGTLGTYVARALLGWGVMNITFVDNSKVSYSNPVRQSLYEFDDCLGGGKDKAATAAEALKRIYPGVHSVGYTLSVPMAGHPIVTEAREDADYTKLNELIDSHDAIFLLMDSREARWLPTIMAMSKNKIVINAALGFDSYLVMRHGVPSKDGSARLGCYFCNDVVAPSDSLKDRTLDQMCTVTRPGVSLMASSLAVELFVSILEHPDGIRAKAPGEGSYSGSAKSQQSVRADARVHKLESTLGIVPHQIRGFLHNFSTMIIRGDNYKFCSACSTAILDEWRLHGWEFVKRALNEPGYVEELSGLAEVQRQAELHAESIEWDSSSNELEDD